MQKIHVHDKALVLILNKREAKALKDRLDQHTGIKKTKALESVEAKLLFEMGEM